MKLRLTIDVDVSNDGLNDYYAKYPGFVTLGEAEHIEQTLFREAVAVWDFEGLLTPGAEPELVEEAPTEAGI